MLCFYAIIESHLRYADVIWGSLSNTKIETLQRLCNRAHSIIKNVRLKDDWSSSWLSIRDLIKNDRSIMAFKIINKLSPQNLWDEFKQRSTISSYQTRNRTDLQIPKLKTEHAKKGSTTQP